VTAKQAAAPPVAAPATTDTAALTCEQTATSVPAAPARKKVRMAAPEPQAVPAPNYVTRLGGRDLRPLVWLGMAGAACFVVLLVVLWGRVAARNEGNQFVAIEPDPHEFLIVTPDNRQIVNDLGRAEWADAATTALRQRDVHIRIVSAKVDAPPLKRSAAGADTSQALVILVQIANSARTAPAGYQGLLKGATPPALTDERGKSYPLRRYPPDALDSTITSNKPVQEWLVFEPVAADVESVKLELPASAWGGSGMCRFHIPRSMMAPPKSTASSAHAQP
jgi:hypothetical protein